MPLLVLQITSPHKTTRNNCIGSTDYVVCVEWGGSGWRKRMEVRCTTKESKHSCGSHFGLTPFARTYACMQHFRVASARTYAKIRVRRAAGASFAGCRQGPAAVPSPRLTLFMFVVSFIYLNRTHKIDIYPRPPKQSKPPSRPTSFRTGRTSRSAPTRFRPV